MGSEIQDLWPEDIGTDVNVISPVSILREQATFLGQRTKNLIEGKVVSSQTSTDQFAHAFFLYVPSMNHYKYLLFNVIHPIDFYPLAIVSEPLHKQLAPAKTEEEFIKLLKEIFSDPKTKAIIASLISQVK